MFELVEYANRLNSEVRNWSKHPKLNQWKFSCLVCGDSATDSRKARFGIQISPDNGGVCHCFNCGYSNTFRGYLKDYHPHLYTELVNNDFLSTKPSISDVNDIFSKVSEDVLYHIFYLNKPTFSAVIDELSAKKVMLSRENLGKLLKIFNKRNSENS